MSVLLGSIVGHVTFAGIVGAVSAAAAWYKAHKSQLAALEQSAIEIGGSALSTFQQIKANAGK